MIADNSVGSDELDVVHEHSAGVDVFDPVRDGAYNIGIKPVECGEGEDLLSASIDWTDSNGTYDRYLVDVEIVRGAVDKAYVQGAWDGGGGVDNPGRFVATATCLQR